MNSDLIQNLLNDIRLLEGEQYSLVQRVRELVKKSVPGASENVKYGGILFSVDEHFCGVFAYKKHVSVEFSCGALINDTPGHLEGNGKGRRHVKLYSLEDIEAKEVARYIPLALEAAKEPLKNPARSAFLSEKP